MEHGLQTALRQDLHLFYFRIRLPDQPYHRFALSTITTPRPTTPRPRPPRLRPTTPTPPTPRRALPRTRHRPKNRLYKVPFLAPPTGGTTTMSRLTTGPPTLTNGPRANQSAVESSVTLGRPSLPDLTRKDPIWALVDKRGQTDMMTMKAELLPIQWRVI